MVLGEGTVFIPGGVGRMRWTTNGHAREGEKEDRGRGLKRHLDYGGMHPVRGSSVKVVSTG